MTVRRLALAFMSAAAMGVPMVVSADSETAIGPVGTTASADLDFEVIIPAFIYFQVGDPAPGTVDTVQFDLSALEPGTGLDVAATGGGVTVALRTNASTTEIVADISAGLLDNGLGDTIPFAEILLGDGGVITVPTFGGPAVSIPGPFNNTDTWTFDYDNAGVYPPGTYTTTVTYTATTL